MELAHKLTHIFLALLAMFALGLSACSSDDEKGDSGTSDASGDADDAGDEEASGGGECPDDRFEGTISREADEGTGQVAGELAAEDVVDARGVNLGLMGLITVYVSDEDLSDRAVGVDTIEASDGGTIVTISLGAEELEVGTELEITGESETGVDPVTVLIDTGGGASVTTSGAEGSATITALSDSEVCFDIDYQDDFQTVQGSVKAALV